MMAPLGLRAMRATVLHHPLSGRHSATHRMGFLTDRNLGLALGSRLSVYQPTAANFHTTSSSHEGSVWPETENPDDNIEWWIEPEKGISTVTSEAIKEQIETGLQMRCNAKQERTLFA